MDGVLVQLPIPEHISERIVCNAVSPEKDVDGFHIINVGRFCVDIKSIIPATPAGVIEMIKRTGMVSLLNKKCHFIFHCVLNILLLFLSY